MNKKILIIGVLAVFMLLAISLVSAINTSTVTAVEKKDSPLFGIRTSRAIGDRLHGLRENIKTRFIGERVFFLPFSSFTFPRLKKILYPEMYSKYSDDCEWTDCMYCTEDGSKFCDDPSTEYSVCASDTYDCPCSA